MNFDLINSKPMHQFAFTNEKLCNAFEGILVKCHGRGGGPIMVCETAEAEIYQTGSISTEKNILSVYPWPE